MAPFRSGADGVVLGVATLSATPSTTPSARAKVASQYSIDRAATPRRGGENARRKTLSKKTRSGELVPKGTKTWRRASPRILDRAFMPDLSYRTSNVSVAQKLS